MKWGFVCLGFQPTNVIMNNSNQLNKFWMSCSNINPKRNPRLFRHSKMTYFYLECQKSIKK